MAIALAAALLGPAAARANTGATLYVDQHNPNCSNTAAGTAAQPFCTIGAAAAKTAPATTVVVSSGTYNEEVRPPVSGTAGSPVVFTAAPGAYVVVTGAPAGGAGKPAFYLVGRSWVTVSGFTITTGNKGVYAVGSSNLAILDNHVTGCALQGIQLNNSTASRVEDNIVDHDRDGVWFNGTTQSSVSGNAIASNNVGIELYGSNDNSLVANVVRDSTAQGVLSQSSTDSLIVNNAISNAAAPPGDTAGYAIDLMNDDVAPPCGSSCTAAPNPPTVGTRILSNSIAQYEPAPAIYTDMTTKTTLADNVIDVFNSAAPSAIRITPNSIVGTSLDYDVVDAPSGKLIAWNSLSYGSSNYASLAKFATATGQETHGIQAPAGFADPANGNLSLTPGSPAVDSAFSGTLSALAGSFALPGTDAWSGARVDDAATPNTGAGTISYADRGAYEMHNFGFETNTDGWNTSGSSAGVTLTRAVGGHTGNGAALLTNSGTSPATCALNDAPSIVHTTTAGPYTATVWVRADNPGGTLMLTLREWIGSTAVGEAKTLVTLGSEWQPVTVQYTAADPGASTLDLNAWVMKVAPGTCFYADDASVSVG